MIEYKLGNLLNVERGVIAHGCNCFGHMGAGVALAIKKAYPLANADYVRYCNTQYTNPEKLLGQICYSRVNPDILIANCFTQLGVSTQSRVVDYEAIAKVFEQLNTHKLSELHIPKIGAGLAGGNWKIIETIINETYAYPVTCYVLDIKEIPHDQSR